MLCSLCLGNKLVKQQYVNQILRTLYMSNQKQQQQQPERRIKPFPVLDGNVDSTDKNFLKNLEVSKSYETSYCEIVSKSQLGGGEKAIARHVKQHKKLLAEDRVKLLLDDYTEFLELSPIAGHAMEYGDVARAGILGGIGKIHGKYCMIIANDGTVKGGTVYPVTLKKQLRLQEIAEQNRIPCIYAVDSGGAFLPLQSEIFLPGGRTFYNEAVMSSMGIPQIAIVVGNCTAGGAYVPTMAEEAVIVHRIGTIFLGGPPLVQAATGEIISAEDLGGATMHCSVSGCTDYYAADEYEGFQTGRDLVETLNLPSHPGPTRNPEEPLFDPEQIQGLIPAQQQETMDIRKVLSRIVDGSRFSEFKVQYGTTLVTGFAHVQGYLVGIIGNNGEITDTAAAKGAHFVQMCSERNIPIVFLHNTVSQSTDNTFGLTGGNFVRDHAKMMAAVSCAKVPKISIVIGNSIGPSNFLMCGRSCSPNFMFSWPNAAIGMMKSSQIVQAIMQEKFDGKDVDNTEEKAELEEKLTQKYSLETSAFYISSRVLDDGIILPQHTRQVIGRCLDITAAYLPRQQTNYPVIRM
ncbi:methylcrotonoyl-CoA carboxylase beta chain, mitochondrial-like [Ruditapes philippinarum]|uniref:methylcrotonoyl-CoA carboxylase beta chain, mitochondrial-like n=1 Tax=Ruditapes philippinarum TaxID=129788 RepID=UPI00295B301E|nr:methylcrotonoyl-CoA carboxylase beta chain, mitochondrial-like [Ruditapes philippinarum]XP_060587920.1 methylcrotonoyl-CoA carboxylase beta chain, mitochondrial-like [Ruditapes philippinarum]